jgi:hypothetical protein
MPFLKNIYLQVIVLSYHRFAMRYHIYNDRVILLRDKLNFKIQYNNLSAQMYETKDQNMSKRLDATFL